MPFELKDVVPWGRSYDEHVAMFALSEADLARRIVGCGDGPAAFNAELTRRGGSIVSVDPLYEFSAGQIARRLDETFDEVMEQTRRNAGEFVWRHIRTPGELGRRRMAAMREFLDDYERGRAEGRYRAQSLPRLDFADGAFDLALCSHFLFLYSDQLDFDFHVAAIAEMLRVAGEARVFPLVMLGAVPSPHVEGVVERFRAEGHNVAVVPVPYEFQRGGDKTLRIKKKE